MTCDGSLRGCPLHQRDIIACRGLAVSPRQGYARRRHRRLGPCKLPCHLHPCADDTEKQEREPLCCRVKASSKDTWKTICPPSSAEITSQKLRHLLRRCSRSHLVCSANTFERGRDHDATRSSPTQVLGILQDNKSSPPSVAIEIYIPHGPFERTVATTVGTGDSSSATSRHGVPLRSLIDLGISTIFHRRSPWSLPRPILFRLPTPQQHGQLTARAQKLFPSADHHGSPLSPVPSVVRHLSLRLHCHSCHHRSAIPIYGLEAIPWLRQSASRANSAILDPMAGTCPLLCDR